MSFQNVDDTNTQMMTELSLRLRNLSFLINHVAEDDSTLDPERLKASLFALHRQVDALSHRLDVMSDRCRTCIECKPTMGERVMARMTDVSLGTVGASSQSRVCPQQKSTA